MPKTRTITVYSFDELSPEAKENALEWWATRQWDDFDIEHITDMFKARLDDLGLPSDKIQWSLAYVQGDGVSFYGPIDLKKYLEANQLWKYLTSDLTAPIEPPGYRTFLDDINISIVGSHDKYYDRGHYMRLNVEVNIDLSPEQQKLLEDLEEHIKEHIADVSSELEKMGYEEIDYMTHGEGAVEGIIANEYEFDEEGNRI